MVLLGVGVVHPMIVVRGGTPRSLERPDPAGYCGPANGLYAVASTHRPGRASLSAGAAGQAILASSRVHQNSVPSLHQLTPGREQRQTLVRAEALGGDGTIPPLRSISARPRASLRSDLIGRVESAALACRASISTTGRSAFFNAWHSQGEVAPVSKPTRVACAPCCGSGRSGQLARPRLCADPGLSGGVARGFLPGDRHCGRPLIARLIGGFGSGQALTNDQFLQLAKPGGRPRAVSLLHG